MAKPFDKKFGWVIKDFSSLQPEKCYSVPVLISDSKWRLIAFPKGNNSDYLSLYLEVYEAESLPCGWRKLVNLRLSIVNQFSQKLSILKETEHCFDGKSTTWGFPAMLSLSKLHENDDGFLVNGEVVIVAELDVFEVIGTLDESAISEEASELVTKKTENLGAESDDLLKKTSPVKERNNVKQVENSVKCSPTNKRMWIAFLVIFLLIGALYVAHEELLGCKNENFYFREEFDCESSFNVRASGEAISMGFEKVLNFERRVLPLSSLRVLRLELLQMEKAEASAARVPLSFNDVVC